MPYKRKYARRKRPRRKPYGTKASFVPRGLAIKRYNQVSTKVFYFKQSGRLNSDSNGIVNQSWSTQVEVPPAPPGIPAYFKMPDISDNTLIEQAYTEYKVLALKVRIFPASVGTEPLGGQPAQTLPFIPLFRGNTVMYVDNKVTANTQSPDDIEDVINLGSAKMINSRRPYTRTLYRPKGYPKWGNCDNNLPVQTRDPDPWWGSCILLANQATPSSPTLWFWTATYKVIYRGRTYTN